jgi:hypothetical protein
VAIPVSGRIVVRLAVDAERNWILGSWKKDAVASAWAENIRPQEYWALMNYVCDRILDSLRVSVAALPDSPTVAVAWLATRPGEILYEYTKPRFRGMGIDVELRASVPEARHRGFNPMLELENLR